MAYDPHKLGNISASYYGRQGKYLARAECACGQYFDAESAYEDEAREYVKMNHAAHAEDRK
jgi:hypothetical protein